MPSKKTKEKISSNNANNAANNANAAGSANAANGAGGAGGANGAGGASAAAAAAAENAVFAAEKIRARERRRRSQMTFWQAGSIASHCILIGALIWFTPLREIIIPERAAREPIPMSADKLEMLSESLQNIRLNELLRELEELQTILYNMDFMKNEILKDYDQFAEQQQGETRESLEQIFDRTILEQEKTIASQKNVQSAADAVAKLEKEDASNTNVVQQLRDARQAADIPFSQIESAQANSQNLLDKAAVEAELVGLVKTAETSAKIRDVQLKANTMQLQVQRDLSRKVSDITSELPRAVQAVADNKATVQRLETELKGVVENIAKNTASIAAVTKEIEAAEKTVEEKKAAQAAAQEALPAAKEALEAANNALAEAKAQKTDAPAEDKKLVDAAAKTAGEAAAADRSARQKAEGAGSELRRSNSQLDERTRALGNAKSSLENSSRRQKQIVDGLERANAEITKNEARIADIDKFLKDPARAPHEAQAEAIKAQEALVENTKLLKELALREEASLERIAQEKYKPQSAATASYAHLDIVDAYEMARELENKVSESYRDIKSAEAAMLRKMSFGGAQKMTDVANTERPEIDQKLLRETPQDKDAFDKQKNAAMDAVREVETMVAANKTIMDAAAEIVGITADGPHAERKKSDRLQRMQELAALNQALSAAAAEDSEQRAKDLASLMGGSDASLAELSSIKSEGDSTPGRVADGSSSVKPAGAPALSNELDSIIPGNVLNLSAASDGVPAQWMYINSWYVIGPFPNPDRVNLRRRFPPESVVDLEATYVGKNDKPIKWVFEQSRSSGGSPGQRALLVPQSQQEYGIWYAYSEVFVDRECDLWLAVGSDDRSDIWLNDMHVWGSSNELKSWRINEGFRRVHFQKGRNRLLARIENGWHAIMWSVCVSTSPDAAQP